MTRLEERAAVHAALGDPGRLAITDLLAVTDLSSTELGQRLGMASNLLAHHLRVLEAAGIVGRHRSQGDRRRGYVRLRLDSPAVAEAMRPLVHPGQVDRVVFLCTHNSARSQLAAALWNRTSQVPATSAGTRPARRVHPSAVRVARRYDLDLGDAVPRAAEASYPSSELVVAVCDLVHEELPAGDRLHWSVDDPAASEDRTAFEDTLTDLSARVDRLAATLPPDRSPR